MSKLRIIEASNELGLGGTEYALQLYSKYLNKKHFEVTVVVLLKGGPREKLIKDMGIQVIILNGDLARLPKLLQETDIFHWHGSGLLDPELFHIVKANKPKIVIQTNVFGTFYHQELYHTIDYDLYISKMILIRRMQADKNLSTSFASKRKVLAYPVEVDHINKVLPTDEQVQQFKTENKLQDSFIVGRIGRPDNAKFDLITLDGFAEFARSHANAKFLLVGVTDKMLTHAKTLNITNRLIIFDNTPDLKRLMLYYKTMVAVAEGFFYFDLGLRDGVDSL